MILQIRGLPSFLPNYDHDDMMKMREYADKDKSGSAPAVAMSLGDGMIFTFTV